MNPRMFFSMALATMSLIFAVGCAHDAKKKSEVKTARIAENVEEARYVAIKFDKGGTRLDNQDKRSLMALKREIDKQGKKVEEIKVLSWADKDYPLKGQTATESEVILARQRGEAIMNYLEKDLHTNKSIDFYNMAKKPNAFSRLFKGDDYNIKESFQKSGLGTNLKGSHASRALIIIEYNEGQKNI